MSKPLNKYLIALSIMFFIGSLSGCSTTSNGFGIGMEGSEHWHGRASKAEITAYWRSESLDSLKRSWSKNHRKPKTRKGISMELERRGEDGQMFYDPAADYQRQAEARELGQAFSQALQEVNRQNTAGPGAGATNQNNAPTVIGSQNITYRQVGNTTYGSDGTSYRKSGNTIYGSDGTSYRQSGNTTYGSDGTSYRKSGNTTYGSDGTSYRQVGNTFYGSDGTNCRAIGDRIYCN